MQKIWQTCKSYFGDGFVSATSPLRFDVHICDIERAPVRNDDHCYGVDLNEDTLPLFTAFDGLRRPPCSCGELRALVEYIEERVKTTPDCHAGDYSLHTFKGDASVEAANTYIMRDALCWWAHWHGALAGHRWKHLYLALSAITDDVQVPPRDIVDGTWRFLGHTLSDILRGLQSEGMHPDDVRLAEMCLLRQCVLQYVEKVDPGLRERVVGKTVLMTQFRAVTANAHGVGVCLTAARGARTRGVCDQALEMSALGDCLSMDMTKEIMGVLQGEKTETVAGDRRLLNQELRWVYARCITHLDAQPDGHVLRRFGTSGFHFTPTMDRYLERVKMVRWPLTPAMRQLVASYVRDIAAACDEM